MKLMRALWKKYPRSAAFEDDFIGLQVGKLKDTIDRVMICLDFDETIFETALQFKPDLILTHHPFIYGKMNEVLERDVKKKELVDRLRREIDCPIVSMHTNFDNAPDGMNDLFATKLDLINIYRNPRMEMMRIGELPEAMSVEVFMNYIVDKAEVTYASLVNAGSDTIRKVGFICGGGSGYFKSAIDEDCDVYISGDCPHHVRREITRYGMNYIDIPHEVERIFIPKMKDVLLAICPDLEILAVDHEVEARMYIVE